MKELHTDILQVMDRLFSGIMCCRCVLYGHLVFSDFSDLKHQHFLSLNYRWYTQLQANGSLIFLENVLAFHHANNP